jgi:hypothetical protein
MRTPIAIIVACLLLSTQTVLAAADAQSDSSLTYEVVVSEMQGNEVCCQAEILDHAKSHCANHCSVAMVSTTAMFSGRYKPTPETYNSNLLRAIVLSLNGPPPISATK